jgi:uncharacterized membrane protein
VASRDNQYRDRTVMKTPVVLVTATLTVAILLAASFLIATGTRGEEADRAISQQQAPAVME